MNPRRVPLLGLILSAALAGCGSDGEGGPGIGTVSVRAYGESFIEDGIPASDVDDGWAIAFSRFDVTLRDIRVGGMALTDPPAVAVDEVSNGQGHELGTVSLESGEYGSPSFTIAQVVVEGSAKKDDVTKTFAWAFDSPTHYEHCQTTTDVREGETAVFQITVHADHLFYDSLVSEEPQLLFQPLADADANADGAISSAELADTDIAAYDPGNEDIGDLWGFLVAQQRTLGHVDGEGHCEASAVED